MELNFAINIWKLQFPDVYIRRMPSCNMIPMNMEHCNLPQVYSMYEVMNRQLLAWNFGRTHHCAHTRNASAVLFC